MSIQTKGKARKIVSPPRMTQRPARAPKFRTCCVITSDHLRPTCNAQEAERNGQEQGKEEQGDRRALRQVAAGDPCVERQTGEYLSRIVRSAASEVIDEIGRAHV